MLNNFNELQQVKDRTLKILVLFSGGASGARYLFESSGNHPGNYEIIGAIADGGDSPGRELFRAREVPVEIMDTEKINHSEDEGDRFNYFKDLLDAVERYGPDLILLSGFMRVVRNPLLDEYAGRIINVHPADLRVEENGKRKYRGTDTVYQTILAGEEEIRSTVHFVTASVDEGPIIVVSEPVPINQDLVRGFRKFDAKEINKYAELLQEGMKWRCDGPAIKKALELIADGDVLLAKEEVLLKSENGFTPGYYDLQKETIVGEKGHS